MSIRSWIRMSLILAMALAGTLTVRLCSLTFLATSFWIHQMAYVENRNPSSGSNFSVARVRPMMPCWQASWNWMELAPREEETGDFLVAWRATVMTRRRLASTRAALARWERRICRLRLGTVWLVDVAHWANVGGRNNSSSNSCLFSSNEFNMRTCLPNSTSSSLESNSCCPKLLMYVEMESEPVSLTVARTRRRRSVVPPARPTLATLLALDAGASVTCVGPSSWSSLRLDLPFPPATAPVSSSPSALTAKLAFLLASSLSLL
mmetsp:Transcript_16594/g.34900  ORF Transcript_16594/g.34900 Transcript_16594/m.34900 type:complete len:264 (+) Transcript_16594:189-980(+)